MNPITNILLADVGAPLVLGLAVGYFTKKTIKFALFLGGMVIVLLFIAENYGITEVSNEGLKQAAYAATDVAKKSGFFLTNRLSHITGKGLSAGVGFLTGLKFG